MGLILGWCRRWALGESAGDSGDLYISSHPHQMMNIKHRLFELMITYAFVSGCHFLEDEMPVHYMFPSSRHPSHTWNKLHSRLVEHYIQRCSQPTTRNFTQRQRPTQPQLLPYRDPPHSQVPSPQSLEQNVSADPKSRPSTPCQSCQTQRTFVRSGLPAAE